MTSLSGFPVDAPALTGSVMVDQCWADVTFLHWPVRSADVARFYPAGTRPDVFDGSTYIGLVPFTMRHTKLGRGLRLPYFGAFHETNVRLYSVDAAGRHGVVFLSLETARLAVVPVIRAALGVPYCWARMRVTRSGGRITYDSERRWPRRGLHSRVTVHVGESVQPTPLETWLTARWGAHTRKAGRTWWVPNEHDPWPLRAAEVVELDVGLIEASGVPVAGERLRALYSPGVHARFGPPVQVP